jgi:hypothetical protein
MIDAERPDFSNAYVRDFSPLNGTTASSAPCGPVAARDGILHAMGDVIVKDLFLHLAQSRTRGRNLRHHLDAIPVFLDHADQAAYLPLDPP